jgi:hypothetical protein
MSYSTKNIFFRNENGKKLCKYQIRYDYIVFVSIITLTSSREFKRSVVNHSFDSMFIDIP